MGFFALLGSVFFGALIVGVIIILAIITFIVSGFQRLCGRGGKNGVYGQGGSNGAYGTGSYSTGPSYRRYAAYREAAARGARSSWAASGRQTVGHDSPGGRDVVEVQILEVHDVSDEKS